MLGGKAFTRPLPFALGTNGAMCDYGIDTTGISFAQQLGMTIYRNDVPWNFAKGGFAGLQSTPGAYTAASITTLQTVASALTTAGLTPIFVITVNQNPGLCPVTTATLAAGTPVSTVSIDKLPFAVTAGDTLTLTNPANQAQTQTVIATAAAAKGSTAPLAVQSFTPTVTLPGGAWIYDAAWPPCTPQHLATLMAHLVAQPGLQGLHWELFNEPDGVTWGVSATLLAQAYQLAYPAMKTADPTCVVHGICLENLAPHGYPEGTDYYNACVTAGILGTYDILSFHQYGVSPTGGHDDCAPDAPNDYGRTFWQMIANFRAVMLAAGDSSPMWLTEFGWQSATAGQMTPQLQAQFLQNLLVVLSGMDPVNRVPFASYLKAVLQFEMTGTFQNWSLIDSSTGPKPAFAVLKALVAGH